MPYCTLSDLKESIREDELISLTDDRVSLASTTLNGVITSTATSITLTDSTGFPDSGRIQIDSEQVDYAGKIGHQLIDCTRGINMTSAAAHADSAAVTELNTINPSVITRAIADADAEINGYCASRYDVPFSTVSDMIRKISVDIAIYNLFCRRRGPSEDRRNRYKDAIALLKGIAQGIVSLVGASAVVSEDDDAGPESSADTDDRIFSMGKLSDSSTGTMDGY